MSLRRLTDPFLLSGNGKLLSYSLESTGFLSFSRSSSFSNESHLFVLSGVHDSFKSKTLGKYSSFLVIFADHFFMFHLAVGVFSENQFEAVYIV